MTRLLHDRYLALDDVRAWDLATGNLVRLDDAGPRAVETLPPSEGLIEVLDHGRDGRPRWVATAAEAGSSAEAAVDRAANDARARGFVPVSVEVYFRLREALREELHGRTLMLIARPASTSTLVREAFVDAAARSPRPHVLLTCSSRSATRPFLVRETPSAYGGSAALARLPRVPLPADVAQHVARALRAAEFVRSGCHAAGERLLRDVAAALMRRRAFEPAAQALTSLGRLLLERGRAVDADSVFEEAAGAAHNGQADALGVDARVWQAVARTDALRLTEAESVCRAVLLTGTLTNGRKAWAEAALARVLLWQHRLDEVRAIDVATMSSGELEGILAVSVAATAVRVLVQQDRIFEAGQRARDSLVLSRTANDPLVRTVASMTHLRLLCASGDLALAEQCLAEVGSHARAARAPLRLVRAQLLWAKALSRAGRHRDAEEAMKYACRMRHAAPPLLRAAIDRGRRGPDEEQRESRGRATLGSAQAAALVRVVQDEDRDDRAIRGVLSQVATALDTSRLDVVSADAGSPSILLTVGGGVPTRLGQRALEAGIMIGPESSGSGLEVAVPVRIGHRLLAAMVARWPLDVTPASHAGDLLEMAAAVSAPRVETLLSSSRDTARAAAAVPELVGLGASMNEVRRAIARAAAAPFAVLIEGESGVGKELVARAIHQLGPRRERRLCDVNCAALPEELLESELFGHVRGAFTGAVADRAGLFEEADGGTVFLDEVADLSPRAQAKLLRVLQQHEVRRVGEAFTRKIDVRIVSAANRDMRTEVADGRFRHDLLYRLDVIRIRIPPLRERPEDIPLLAEHCWRASAARLGTTALLTHGVIAALSRYHWPGNVRELQNVIAALAVAAPSRGRVRPSLLPSVITGVATLSSSRLSDARSQFERRFIEVAIARAGGSRTRAARDLGLSRQGLLKMIARLGVETTEG